MLVFPDIRGLGDHAKKRAERLASELGFVALACDLHGKQRIVDDLQVARSLVQELRQDACRLRARTGGALDALKRRGEVDLERIGAIGFCQGGTMALELALSGAALKGWSDSTPVWS